MGYVIMIVLILAVAGYLYYQHIKSTFDCTDPDPDAEIVSVNSEEKRSGRSRYIQTTVLFSDRYKYITSQSDYGFFSRTVTEETVNEIKAKAIEAHRIFVEKTEKKRQKQNQKR